MEIKSCRWRYNKRFIESFEVFRNTRNLVSARQWTYQTCTEFGFYQTADNATESIFGDRFDVDFFIKQCSDIYGIQFNAPSLAKAIQRTNTYYGELHVRTTNVIYVHGSIDPWHALGLIKSTDPKMPTIYIQGKSTKISYEIR